MKKIIIADYLGNSNYRGEISGHLLKVLLELSDLLSDQYELQYAVCSNYAERIADTVNVIAKLKRISCHKNKVLEVIQRWLNIKKVLKNGQDIWFVNIDFWFFLIILFANTKNKNIYTTNYVSYDRSGTILEKAKKFFYCLANKKIRTEFTTSKKLWNDNQEYIPDYWFDSNYYKKYATNSKELQTLFCGGISQAKDVLGLISAYGKNHQKLVIKGKFESDELFKAASKVSASNVTLVNDRMSDYDYYSSIASSKFVVLPYKKENYAGRSSGVILECVFMNCLVIAPNFLLNELGISGVGYDSISELEKFNMQEITLEKENQILEANKKIQLDYSKENVKKIYCKVFGDE